MVKHEPELRRARARRYVEACNNKVHAAPWKTGRTQGPGAGGLYEALEMAEQAFAAHALPYEQGLSRMKDYDPRRFRWVYEENGKVDECVKLLDIQTGNLVVWPHWAG
jgi:hypothetical protein